MSSETSDPALLRFRDAVSERVGIAFDDDKLALLQSVMLERVRRTSLKPEAYCHMIEQRPGQELGALADVLTVAETYFFRNTPHFDALRERVLPECLERLPHDRKLRVLSAACATGEEPYSLAMLCHDLGLGSRVEITGFDLSPLAIERARRGIYTDWSLRETKAAARSRWFQQSGREHQLDPLIRADVTLLQGNLMEDDSALFRPAYYDVILCRNVLMYFTAEAMRTVVQRLAQSLVPHGFLFLGHAENLRGVSQAFHLCHTHGTFYYQLADATRATRSVQAQTARDESTAAILGEAERYRSNVPPAPPAPHNADWFDSIQRASARIASMTPAPAAANHEHVPSHQHARVLDLMRTDQGPRALELLRDSGRTTPRDADGLLLEAALLLQQGDLEAAEQRCRTLLDLDELSAGAHYMLALCEERRGALDSAARHDETAAYLDPRFAMPHVHLGLLLRRAGRLDSARTELLKACSLLDTEDVARLILFGGGFDRDALKALCRAELAAVESRRE